MTISRNGRDSTLEIAIVRSSRIGTSGPALIYWISLLQNHQVCCPSVDLRSLPVCYDVTMVGQSAVTMMVAEGRGADAGKDRADREVRQQQLWLVLLRSSVRQLPQKRTVSK